MACSYGVNDIVEFQAAKALAAVEQPRPVSNQLCPRALPHAELCRQTQSFLLEKLPLDCRLLVWKHVLKVPYTRIERWRPPYYGGSISAYGVDALDANCFPYRLSTPHIESYEATIKPEKPIALLLSCRQIYSEAVQVLYASTTFVFAIPMDIHCFQVTASPEGLASVKSLIISFGKIDRPNYGPFHQEEGLREWEEAFHSLGKMPFLHELQIWLYHGGPGQSGELAWPRRPWEVRMGSEAVEHRHKMVFDLFATSHVPDFTVNLTWKPEDLLSQPVWPIRLNVQTYRELFDGMLKFPYPVEPDLWD